MRKAKTNWADGLLLTSATTALLATIAASPNGSAQSINALHQFGGGHGVVVDGTLDGYLASGGLAASGNVLYGTTAVGGFGVTDGIVYSIDENGTGYKILASFTGEPGPYSPNGGVVVSPDGSMLYGDSAYGGVPNPAGAFNRGMGTVYSVAANGSTGITTLYQFGGSSAGDGAYPTGRALVLADGTLYGMTTQGGTSGDGTIFAVPTASPSGETVLHSFTGGPGDGATPVGSLILAGGTLYGETTQGGADGGGIMFSISPTGSGYHLLHSFGSATEPNGMMAQSGATLFGTTQSGGTNGDGTLFSFNTATNIFQVLHSFGTGSADGQQPLGTLVLSGSTLYGTTLGGGSPDASYGTIFSINTDGTGYSVLANFGQYYPLFGGTFGLSGGQPGGRLVMSGSTLYGSAANGGTYDDGTVWSFTVPEANTMVLLFSSAVVTWLLRRWPRLKLSQSMAERLISMEVDRA